MKTLAIALILLLSGCQNFAPSQRLAAAQEIADSAGFHQQIITQKQFDIVTFIPSGVDTLSKVYLYIEGDGFAWKSRYKPSTDPTPFNPIALKLAAIKTVKNNIYLARPCQFATIKKNCRPYLWTDGRFSNEAIKGVNSSIDQLKRQYGIKDFVLIGFSGGGAVASIIAAKRSDVSGLVTIAGNLNHAAWTSYHGVTALTSSLSPVDFISKLENIPQIHFLGTEDKIVPSIVAQSYSDKFSHHKKPLLVYVKEADHQCCWVEKWPELLKLIPF